MSEKISFSNNISQELLDSFYAFARDQKVNKQLAIEAAFKFIQLVPKDLQRLAIRGEPAEIEEWFREREAARAESKVRRAAREQDQEQQSKHHAGRQQKSGGKRG